MHTTRKSSARRTLARVAIAGALTAIPLTALAVPASATPAVPGVTEVRHGHHCRDRGPWEGGFFEHSRHDRWDNDYYDRCDRHRRHNYPDSPFDFWNHHRPGGGLFFGSS